MKIKTILLTTLLLLFFNFSYCQQKTAYEKKVEELSLQLFKNLGVSQTQISKAKEIGEIEAMFMSSVIMYRLSTVEGMVLMERFNKEVKKAEILKTEVDFKKDKFKKNKEITLKAEIEQEKKRKELLEEFNSSDYSKISKSIKSEFEKWLTKSEFEKQDDFEKRIKENNQKSFDSICNSVLLNAISNANQYNNLSLEVGEYNADKEYFKVKIKIFKTEINEILDIKLTDAKIFKENYNTRSYKRSAITISKSLNHWVFNNNELTPTIFDFNIYNKDIYDTNYVKDFSKDVSIELKNKKALNFNSNELNIKNENFAEVKFDFKTYNDQLKKKSEIENIIFDINNVEVKPEFIGGVEKFYEFLGKNIKSRIDYDYEFPMGKIKVSYIIEKDGSLSNPKLIKDTGNGAGKILIDALKYSPKWKPGITNGTRIRVQDTLSIKLRAYNPKDYFDLIYRDAISLPQPKNNCKENGKVSVKITIDGEGNVIEAIADEQENKNISSCLLEEAKLSALNSKFDNTNEKMRNEKNMSEQERYNRVKYKRRQTGYMFYYFEN
jgi:hypothetical protein